MNIYTCVYVYIYHAFHFDTFERLLTRFMTKKGQTLFIVLAFSSSTRYFLDLSLFCIYSLKESHHSYRE